MIHTTKGRLLLIMLLSLPSLRKKICFPPFHVRESRDPFFALGFLVFFTCSDNVEVAGDFFLFGINVCYGATGLFHGGFKKLDGPLKKR